MSFGCTKSDGASRGSSGDASTEKRPRNAARILVVDDRPDTLRGMAILLTRAGYVVHTAPGAKSALEAIAQHSFEVMISDLVLADMDGCELMRRLREQSSCAGIAISGDEKPSDKARSHAAGFVEYFVKPIEFNEFLDAVARTVALRGQGSEPRESSARSTEPPVLGSGI